MQSGLERIGSRVHASPRRWKMEVNFQWHLELSPVSKLSRYFIDILIGLGKNVFVVYVSGAVDGKHVRIQKPRKAGSLYYNYKSYHSVILLAVVNANYEFICIDVGSYGHNCDSTIFKDSNFGRKLMDGSLGIPDPVEYPGSSIKGSFCLISDEGFPLHKNIMRPYPLCTKMPIDQKVFNYRLSRARMNAECTLVCFGQSSEFLIHQSQLHRKKQTLLLWQHVCCTITYESKIGQTWIEKKYWRKWNFEAGNSLAFHHRQHKMHLHMKPGRLEQIWQNSLCRARENYPGNTIKCVIINQNKKNK